MSRGYELCRINDGILDEKPYPFSLIGERGTCSRCSGTGALSGSLFNHGTRDWVHHACIVCLMCKGTGTPRPS